MKVTVLWEDQRSFVVKGFGPHELLIACVAEEIGQSRASVASRVFSFPKKGNGNVLLALERDLARLTDTGPVCAVLDRDKVRNLFGPTFAPHCLSGIKQAVSKRAPGTYELVLLDQNVETLVTACCQVQQAPGLLSKPTPDQRDRIITKTAWSFGGERKAVRTAVPSFDRLVKWVSRQLVVSVIIDS